MRLDKNNSFFTIITNESGKILSVSGKDVASFSHKCVGDDVYDLVNASELRKLSMYSSMATVVETAVNDFPTAIMRATLKNYVKAVEICFIPKIISAKMESDKDSDTLSLYAENRGSVARIEPREYMERLLCTLKSQKMGIGIDVSINGNTDEIAISPVCLELLFFTTVAILVDLSFKDKISINLSKNKISFSLTSELLKKTQRNEFFKNHPHIVAKWYLIRSVCEDEGVDMGMSVSNGTLTFDYGVSKIVAKNASLNSVGSKLSERILVYIDTLFA